MKTYHVVFTAAAEGDLDAIYAHVAAASGTSRAGSVIGSLVRTCLSLDLFPHRGRPRDDLLPGLRVIAHRGWASIAFTIEDSAVTIEGVLWRGRDLGSAFDRAR